nr:hypothetical protein [uncultured Campylobacter sp.]
MKRNKAMCKILDDSSQCAVPQCGGILKFYSPQRSALNFRILKSIAAAPYRER